MNARISKHDRILRSSSHNETRIHSAANTKFRSWIINRDLHSLANSSGEIVFEMNKRSVEFRALIVHFRNNLAGYETTTDPRSFVQNMSINSYY